MQAMNGIYSFLGTYAHRWFRAVNAGDLESIKTLVTKVNVNAYDDQIMTALLISAQKGDKELVKFLLGVPGINVNAYTTIAKNTALILATINGHEDIVQLLVQNPSINVNMRDVYNKSALHYAIKLEHNNIVKLLLQAPNIEINPNDFKDTTIYSQRGILKFLLQNGYNFRNIEKSLGGTLFISAAMYAPENLFTILCKESHIDINKQQSTTGDTALIKAVKRGRLNIVKILLDHHADVNIQNKDGYTALMLATAQQHEDTVKLLLQAPKIDVNIKKESGHSAPTIAYVNGYINILKLLLEAPRIKLAQFYLYYPSKVQDRVLVEQLITLVNTKESELINRAVAAIQDNNLAALKLIIEQIGLDLKVDTEGNTLLHIAFLHNATEIIYFMLQYTKVPTALLTATNNKGLTPFELANPNSELFRLMLDLAYAKHDSTI